jgi:hypothetical protein
MSDDDDNNNNGSGGGDAAFAMKDGSFKLKIVDVAEILVAPVCVTYVTDKKSAQSSSKRGRKKKDLGNWGAQEGSEDNDDEDDEDSDDDCEDLDSSTDGEKVAAFWMVILKTRKCYNFPMHVNWLINTVDKDDKNNMKRSVTKEYEEVMDMLREVILYQYEQSPNAVSYFRSEGVGTRVDPFQRITEVCTPDSLDHVCSIFEAYRSMVFQVKKQGVFAYYFSSCIITIPHTY